MNNYNTPAYYPVVMSLILLAIIDSTPDGGASLCKLKGVYESYMGRVPCDRTIWRIVDRLNDGIDPAEPAITKSYCYDNSTRRRRKKYKFTKQGYLYSYLACGTGAM
jgi:hypothetical protein